MTTYYIMISQTFPKTHNRHGQKTGFVKSISDKIKLHTIRGNYAFWEKRFEKIKKGEAYLSVRVWKGEPYKSNHVEVFRYNNTDEIGIEKLTFKEKIMTPFECIIKQDRSIYTPNETTLDELAKNDGLSLPDFKEWFKKCDLNKPMAIIHFTEFRYKK